MSNSLGHCFIHHTLCQSTFLEHQSKTNSRIGCNSTCQVTAASLSKQSACQLQSSLVSANFCDNTLNKTKRKPPKERHSAIAMIPRAVLAADPSSEVAGKFSLDGNSELQVGVSSPNSGALSLVDIQITNSSNSLILHWGAIRDGNKNWALPSCCPDGTRRYKNRALRTPFRKSGPNSSMTIEIDDPEIQAIEFLILDEERNKWFKDDGKNFSVQIRKDKVVPNVSVPSNVSVPEDLVQIQAYIRWERKGKQAYTPEQEKEEYAAARTELLQEVARGTSIEELRAKLTKKDIDSRKPVVSESKIPNDLVQIQAYIRWEKAGKPNYPPDKQLMEFEEARKELQLELDRGTSLDEIRKKIVKGNIETKVSKQLATKKYFSVERIQRKKRDVMQFLNKYATEAVEEKDSTMLKAPTMLELWSQAKAKQDGGRIMSKKFYKLDDSELQVLVTNNSSKTKVSIATNLTEPVTLHWALSKKAGEWTEPPSSILPPGSILLGKACETQFVEGDSADPSCQVKYVEVEVDEGDFKGMPFVLLSSGKWLKNDGCDFYVDFSSKMEKATKDSSAGEGTAKAFLEKIAEMESEAQKSFMHRFNIAADLTEWAKNIGELGFAGILVWMRFMATRQLIWNKNYNVKPREISRAQDRLTDLLQNVFISHPQYREIVRMIMSTVGRGGEGDIGQRIRDEILVIQRKNDCKGGMMEEWHQKLHNNTSPDDIVICQALIDYIKSDFNIDVYWKTLKSNGITKERLLSYDRAIHSEPRFRSDQKEGLLRDLGHYMRTLKVGSKNKVSSQTICHAYWDSTE